MASIISSGTTSGTALNISGDTSGVLQLATNGTTTALTLDASQNATFAGSVKTNTLTSAASTALTLQSAGTTAITIDTSQNVGIGTTSPTSGKLVISGTSVTTSQGIRLVADTADARFICESATLGAGILGTFSAHSQLFYTNSAERMRIESSGVVRINNTSDATFTAQLNTQFTSSKNCGMYLKVTDTSSSQSMMIFGNTTSDAVGAISTNGSATSYQTSSDYRLKENIAPMTGALAKVAQLKPVTYKWKTDGSDGQGFIAHELQAVVPDCVTGEKDATREQEYEVTPAVKDEEGNITTPAVMGTRTIPSYQGVDTSFLVATLTAALQETKALIDTQAETINALTARIVALEGA
jgi:hypothetical protein